jgi:hypothetical protein
LKQIALLYKTGQRTGTISILHGEIESGRIVSREGSIPMHNGRFSVIGASRLELDIINANLDIGAHSSIVTIQSDKSFSFFVRDVCQEYPIYLPLFDAIVTDTEDRRDYEEIVKVLKSRGLLTNLQKIDNEPEESYEAAAQHTRELSCPTWLGLSRDIRIFEAGYRGNSVTNKSWGGNSDTGTLWDWVQPRYHGEAVRISEGQDQPVSYQYLLGRGLGCEYQISRRLENGVLPILNSRLIDGETIYETTAFVSYERTSLTPDSLKGTHYLVADNYGMNHMFTEEQQKSADKLLLEEMNQDEETVYYSKTVTFNTSDVPRYVWFKNLIPNGNVHSRSSLDYSFDGTRGFGLYNSGNVYCVTKLNGKPLPQEEVAILLKPGENVTFEFYLPHRPISQERASELLQQDFSKRHRECKAFWTQKLSAAAVIKIPEQRLEEMIQAGLLHLDLITYGQEPAGTVVPTIGVYTAIGSESSPIIQFMDSMGWHDLARRALTFFLDKQHDDGLMQNFDSYMLETGAVLWSIGEHYRYTKDTVWILEIRGKLEKAYRFISDWRKRNMREELIGKGYGMLEGKTADPEDPFRSFMLNGYAYLGLNRLAEMLMDIDVEQSRAIAEEAALLKADIRFAFKEATAKSPVVPLGNGTWASTSPPWADYRGPVSLYAEGEKWVTHGSPLVRDSLLGPLYLIFQEILDPLEEESGVLLQYHNELMCMRNVALSQPYYSIHPWVHLMRKEVKPFLKAFYNGFAGLSDRETYTFWEHFWHASPHKTHEEGWFLMQCRWMLYMEQERTLKLLSGVPRAWLENGKTIAVKNASSYFGHFTMTICSKLGEGVISAEVECESERKPAKLEIRLPHPEGQKPVRVSGGRYDVELETITVNPFDGKANVRLYF